MANYQLLKADIDAKVYENTHQEITGADLNAVLNAMVTTLGAGYQFAGVATTATNPGSPDAKVFYIANGKGTYEKFGGIEVTEDDVVVLYWDSSWHKVSTGIASQEKLTELESETNENIAELGVYVENPEWVKVVTDREDKILYGVKTDGGFYFGCGCPTQVVEYVQNKINELSLDEYEDIVTFLGDLIDGPSLATLLNAKLDKESLDADALATVQTAENPEFIQVTTDSGDKILEGITRAGVKKINLPIDTPSAAVEHVENPEYASALTDEEDKVIEAITKDGQKRVFIPLRNEYIENKINEINQKTKALYNPKSYYDKGDNFSPLIKNNEGKPLIYQASAYFNRPICYPNGTVIYGISNEIRKKGIDGSETTLLTVEGAISFRLIWMDSNYNVYVSPEFNGVTYYQNSGLYKLTYGDASFTHVLSLSNLYSESSSERESESYTIWTMTEDREGNLYVGIYGSPKCPYLYKSTDGGDNWNFIKDLSLIVPGGKHIHFIVYNKYDNALYCTVGEVNMLIKSTDGGNTWVDCNVAFERMKSTSACVVSDGIVFGSDYAYWGMMYKLYADGSYKTTAKIWANAIFSIRQSDLTGYLYAIGVIDASVNSLDWYPPVEAISDDSVLQNWIESVPSHLSEWQEYYESMLNVYPSDAIRPQHSAILISKDNGESWEVLLRLSEQTSGALGTFKNGECSFTLAGTSHGAYVISEGKHNYTEGGIDCTGEVLIKLNNTNIVNQI